MPLNNNVINWLLELSMPVLKLTKSKVDGLPFTNEGQVLYHDTDLRGFGLVVGSRTKTYFAQAAVNRKTVRYTIGRHGVFTAEEARKEARNLLADMFRGNNPNKIKEEQRFQGITLEAAFEYYLKTKQDLGPRSRSDYRIAISSYLSDWKDTSLKQVTKRMVIERNAYIREHRGGAVATKAMRVLSAVYNYTKLSDDELPENPVTALSRGKLWFKSERRHTVIKPHQLKAWYEAVQAQANGTVRDYLLLLLFTGMRKSEGMYLTWDCIDFEEGTLLLKQTKNGRAHTLPLSDYTKKLLQDRYENRTCGRFVFPGSGKSGHLEEPKKVIKKVTEESGVKFMLHDLRRTFITTAESLEISAYALKYMINHKTGNDLTGGYIILDVNRIKEPIQRVSDKLLGLITMAKLDSVLTSPVA